MSGVISGGLYVSLRKFPPSGAGVPQEEPLVAPSPHARQPASAPSAAPEIPRHSPTAAPAPSPLHPPPPQVLPHGRQPPFRPPEVGGPLIPVAPPPDQGPGPMERSEEFRAARRAVFTEGIEPIWVNFDGQELEILKRTWERYQKRQQKKRK